MAPIYDKWFRMDRHNACEAATINLWNPIQQELSLIMFGKLAACRNRVSSASMKFWRII